MGNTAQRPRISPRIHQNSVHPKCQITRHFYKDIKQLAIMFNNFMQQPYQYACTVSIESEENDCCQLSCLVLHTKPIEITLDHLFVIKRKHKQSFSQQQIWFTLKYIAGVFGYLEDRTLAYGIIHPNSFILDSGRHLRIGINHLRPKNEHFYDYKITNYYSPEYYACLKKDEKSEIESINKYKSQVFSAALLILEMSSIPHPKPKFYSLTTKEINSITINHLLSSVTMNYSQALFSILSKMLAIDIRSRADWTYVNQWIFRNQDRKFEVSPCIFGLY